jgi:hypothetical protein
MDVQVSPHGVDVPVIQHTDGVCIDSTTEHRHVTSHMKGMITDFQGSNYGYIVTYLHGMTNYFHDVICLYGGVMAGAIVGSDGARSALTCAAGGNWPDGDLDRATQSISTRP